MFLRKSYGETTKNLSGTVPIPDKVCMPLPPNDLLARTSPKYLRDPCRAGLLAYTLCADFLLTPVRVRI